MKTFLAKLKTRETLEWCLDTFSLLSVLQYCAYRFLQSTMFVIYYSQRYKILTMGLLLLFGGIRYLYVLGQKWKEKDRGEKRRFVLRICGVWLLALPFFYVGWLHDYKNLIFLPICCMCLYDMEADKVIKGFIYTIGTLFAATILCCLSGTVRNLVSQDTSFAGAYGIINTTDFASYFSFLLILTWCGMRGHKWATSLLFVAFTVIITYVVYKHTESRTLLYTSGLTIFFVLWDCLEESKAGRLNWFRPFRSGIKWLSIVAFPIIGGLVIYLTIQYTTGSSWASELNETLSGRLSTVLNPFDNYGIRPFGSDIENLHGQGGTILGDFWTSGYGYLDVAYAMLAIRYGWIITVIIAGMWIWMSAEAFKAGKRRIGYALAILAAHAFSEARILDVNYNILLIMPFCSFAAEKDAVENLDDRKSFKSAFFGIALAGLIYLLLPNGLSWLRTFFFLKKWNYGTYALNSLCCCVGAVVCLLFLWKTGSTVWVKSDMRQVVPLTCILVLFIVGLITVNNTIECGRFEQADRLKIEEQVIRGVQEVATMPVYAANSEELYRRDGLELAPHLFSVEELGRSKGTIIVDGEVDALSIILSGGMYAQLSNQTGLYTYDQPVIETLKASGFAVTRCYTGMQRCDLRDLALFNDMKIDGQFVLESRKVITTNIESDQLFGQYQVRFSFSGLSMEKEGDVILLEVLGEHGDQTIHQETLTSEDFNVDGICEYTLKYQVNPTPAVSFAITPMDGVKVTIDDISWNRTYASENEDLLHATIQIKQHESSGVEYIGNSDGTVAIRGEANGISFYNIYLNKNGFPDWMQKGKEYVIQIDDPSEMVSFEIYLYDANGDVVFPALVSTKTSQVFHLPDDAYGIIIRFRAWEGKPVNTIVTPIIREN